MLFWFDSRHSERTVRLRSVLTYLLYVLLILKLLDLVGDLFGIKLCDIMYGWKIFVAQKATETIDSVPKER